MMSALSLHILTPDSWLLSPGSWLLLAQSPAPEEIKSWLSVLFYFGGFIATLLGGLVALKKLRTPEHATPQPFLVQEHAGVATKDDLAKIDSALHGRLKRERVEIDDAIKRVEQAAEKRSDRLEIKVDENTHMTSEMKGIVGQMNQNLHQLSTGLTNFLQNQAK